MLYVALVELQVDWLVANRDAGMFVLDPVDIDQKVIRVVKSDSQVAIGPGSLVAFVRSVLERAMRMTDGRKLILQLMAKHDFIRSCCKVA